MGKVILIDEFNAVREKAEELTGFATPEPTNVAPQTWYGTSDKLAEFKAIVEDYIPTGTVAYCMDTGTYEMWSAFKKQWY